MGEYLSRATLTTKERVAFMFSNNSTTVNEHQPSIMQDCFLDFMLSRQAMLCTPQTQKFYMDTLSKFLKWIDSEGIYDPERITPRHVRSFLSIYAKKGCKDSYIHTYARSIRTFLRFLYKEEYIPELVQFEMPRIGDLRLPVLSIEEIKKVLNSCSMLRDRSIILLMVDTGLRRAELIDLNWKDVDLKTGICIVRRGKGKKSRSVVLGAITRRALLSYKRKLNSQENDPVFQTNRGKRFTQSGLRSLFVRLSKRSGVPFSAHSLRRSFVVLSLKGGMSLAHIQALMGHSTPTMTLHYAQLADEDLLIAHQEHGPIDNFLK